MPTSARWEATNSPKILVKMVHSAGGQSRPPLRDTADWKTRCRGRRLCRPDGQPANSPQTSAKKVRSAGSMWASPPTLVVRIRIGFTLLAAACRDLSGASRQLPLKGEPWGGALPYPRCRTASYNKIAAALDALRDEIWPCMGILTLKSHASATRRLMPSPSLPMTMAAGPLRSA